MWLLKSDSGTLIYLKPNETLTVGRNTGDIVLSDDGSISRVHAKITVEPVEDIDKIQENTEPLSICTIKDPKSKYGNFVIKDGSPDIKITEDGYILKHMDRIRFGLQNYIFTALYVPIITATSGMNETEKKQLKQIIDAIDGKIIYVWTSMCTHMTIETPTISEKFSCALALGTPIVSLVYWKAVLKAFQNNEPFPEPADFAAAINNQLINVGKVCVKPNPMRKTCLQNLTFIHFNSKQFSLYNRMIKLSGGIPIKYGKQRLDLDVSSDNVIVVQLVESNTTQATGTGDANYAAVCEQLSRCRRRTIPECEIALAILHCSTNKYCNPKYDYAELFRNRNSQIPESNSDVLALDTQDIEDSTNSGSQRHNQSDIVPETVDQSRQFEDHAPTIIRQGPIDCMSESTASSSYNCDSMGSIKLVSLNHERYLEEEFNKRSIMNEKSMKRDREGDVIDIIDKARKKIRLGVSVDDEDRYREPSVTHKSRESDEDWLDGDVDMGFVDKKRIGKKEEPEETEGKPDLKDNSFVANKRLKISDDGYANHNFDEEAGDRWALWNSKRTASCYHSEILVSEERSSTTDDDVTSRKRNGGGTGTSPSWDFIESSRNRNETVPKNEKEISEQPRPGISKEKGVFAMPKVPTKTDPDEGIWNRTKNYQSADDLNSTADSMSNTSDECRLRARSTKGSIDSAMTKFKKSFRRRRKTIPRRVELYDAENDTEWMNGTDSDKHKPFNNEEVTTPHKVSPNTISKSKKMFRV